MRSTALPVEVGRIGVLLLLVFEVERLAANDPLLSAELNASSHP